MKNFLDLFQAYGYKSMSAFSKEFEIPYRTVQSWCLGDREPPDYLVNLIEFKLRTDKGIVGYRILGSDEMVYPTFTAAEDAMPNGGILVPVEKEKGHGN